MQPLDTMILASFGDGDSGRGSSYYPELDEAARAGKGGTVEICRQTYHKCPLTSQELKSKAMYFKNATPLIAMRKI